MTTTPIILEAACAEAPAIVGWISRKGAIVYTTQHPALVVGELVDLVFVRENDVEDSAAPNRVSMTVRARIETLNGTRSKVAMVTFLDPPCLK